MEIKKGEGRSDGKEKSEEKGEKLMKSTKKHVVLSQNNEKYMSFCVISSLWVNKKTDVNARKQL